MLIGLINSMNSVMTGEQLHQNQYNVRTNFTNQPVYKPDPDDFDILILSDNKVESMENVKQTLLVVRIRLETKPLTVYLVNDCLEVPPLVR